jgi:hypothetical protein
MQQFNSFLFYLFYLIKIINFFKKSEHEIQKYGKSFIVLNLYQVKWHPKSWINHRFETCIENNKKKQVNWKINLKLALMLILIKKLIILIWIFRKINYLI